MGRCPLTAASAHECDSLVVTHPFHPLSGQRVSILFERRSRSTHERSYVCDAGALGTVCLPEGFTDRGRPAFSRPLTVDTLVDLATVVAALHQKA